MYILFLLLLSIAVLDDIILKHINASSADNQQSITIDEMMKIDESIGIATSSDNERSVRIFSNEELLHGITLERFKEICTKPSINIVFHKKNLRSIKNQMSSTSIVEYLKEKNLTNYFKSTVQLEKYLTSQGMNITNSICRSVLKSIGIKCENKYNLIPGILEIMKKKGNHVSYGVLPSSVSYKSEEAYNNINFDDYSKEVESSNGIMDTYNNNIYRSNNMSFDTNDKFDEDLLGCSISMENNQADNSKETTKGQDSIPEFLYYFVSLKSNIELYNKIDQPIIFLDGTHITRSKQTILTAVTITIERKILLLAFGLYAVECTATWTNFQKHLKISLEEQNCNIDNISFFSDMDKGLKNSIYSIFPNCVSFSCAFHVMKKICRKGSTLATILPQLILADNIMDWEEIIEEAHLTKHEMDNIEKYRDNGLYNIDINNRRIRRFGYIASSPAESFNNAIYDLRRLPVHKMLIEIYNYGHAYQLSTINKTSDNTFLDYFQANYDFGGKAIAEVNHYNYDDNNMAGRVMIDDEYIVNYRDKTCNCGIYQFQEYPCFHAIVLFRKMLDDVHNNKRQASTIFNVFNTFKQLYSYRTRDMYYNGYIDRSVSSNIINSVNTSSISSPKYTIRSSGRPSKVNFSNFKSYYYRHESWQIKRNMPALESLMESITSNESILQKARESDSIDIPSMDQDIPTNTSEEDISGFLNESNISTTENSYNAKRLNTSSV
ncbi:hypothetical protein WA158_002624 [Blastocystis sp. Blastoise]